MDRKYVIAIALCVTVVVIIIVVVVVVVLLIRRGKRVVHAECLSDNIGHVHESDAECLSDNIGHVHESDAECLSDNIGHVHESDAECLSDNIGHVHELGRVRGYNDCVWYSGRDNLKLDGVQGKQVKAVCPPVPSVNEERPPPLPRI